MPSLRHKLRLFVMAIFSLVGFLYSSELCSFVVCLCMHGCVTNEQEKVSYTSITLMCCTNIVHACKTQLSAGSAPWNVRWAKIRFPVTSKAANNFIADVIIFLYQAHSRRGADRGCHSELCASSTSSRLYYNKLILLSPLSGELDYLCFYCLVY